MNYKALIIGIIIGAMGIIGASLAVGISTRDVEIEDNAYEAGLHYDQACKRKAELGWQVHLPRTVTAGSSVIPVEVHDRTGAKIRDADVVLELDRRGSHDVRAYRCTNNGRYEAAVKLDTPGYWDARIQVTRRNDTIRFEEAIYVQ